MNSTPQTPTSSHLLLGFLAQPYSAGLIQLPHLEATALHGWLRKLRGQWREENRPLRVVLVADSWLESEPRLLTILNKAVRMTGFELVGYVGPNAQAWAQKTGVDVVSDKPEFLAHADAIFQRNACVAGYNGTTEAVEALQRQFQETYLTQSGAAQLALAVLENKAAGDTLFTDLIVNTEILVLPEAPAKATSVAEHLPALVANEQPNEVNDSSVVQPDSIMDETPPAEDPQEENIAQAEEVQNLDKNTSQEVEASTQTHSEDQKQLAQDEFAQAMGMFETLNATLDKCLEQAQQLREDSEAEPTQENAGQAHAQIEADQDIIVTEQETEILDENGTQEELANDERTEEARPGNEVSQGVAFDVQQAQEVIFQVAEQVADVPASEELEVVSKAFNKPFVAPKRVAGIVRTGTVIRHDGDVIIEGAVHDGAEIYAGGDIHIYGLAGGRLFAGCYGNPNACLYINRFDAEIVSIDGHTRVFEETPLHWIGAAMKIQLDPNTKRLRYSGLAQQVNNVRRAAIAE